MKFDFLTIEGNIGSGKTSLAKKIASDFNGKLILEEFADNPFLPKFYKDSKPKILMHCFTGSTEFAHKLLTLDSYFSASGIITFKNSVDLKNTFKLIPNNKLLIETDSPYLSPVPFRGKKNEPSFIKYTIKKLADLKGVDEAEMINITSKNFENLFFN